MNLNPFVLSLKNSKYYKKKLSRCSKDLSKRKSYQNRFEILEIRVNQ